MDQASVPPTAAERLAFAKAKAEQRYDQMYECQSHELKDLKDDALMFLAQAQEAAKELGLVDEAAALQARAEHFMAVYWQLR